MKKWILFLILLKSASALAQNVDSARVDLLARAIAYAEGFGKKNAIPTRYHNPGDIKAAPGVRYPGQRGIGKSGHVIFRTDADGWAALRRQIMRITEGTSRNYRLDMSIRQVASKYAGRSRIWANSVSRVLDVPTTTTLREFLTVQDTPLLAICD